eukprot:11037428-Prorocentrum_lima.AAC.1
MTSSLVGSEMCIRDSGQPAAQPQALRACFPATLGVRVPPSRAGCLVAVSYTHLTLPTICSV